MQYLLLFNLFIWFYAILSISFSQKGAVKTKTTDITYEEIINLNGNCSEERDTCKTPRTIIDDRIPSAGCHCNKFCVNYRTCCLDSPYRNLKPTVLLPSCKTPLGKSSKTFITDKCPDGADSNIKIKCEEGSIENDDRLLSLVPVTSLSTNMTYGNFFCFRCNEEHDEFLYWDVKLQADLNYDTVIEAKNILLVYNNTRESWLTPFGDDGELIDVQVAVDVPLEISFLIDSCVEGVIAKCADNWTDDEIRKKCNYPYMLLTGFERESFVFYKNPHCALCNFEDLNEKACYDLTFFWISKAFSFSLLLDINKSDGDKVGKIQKCEMNYKWDPHFKKCRELKCALPGYVVKEGKCIKSD